jgi:hypothetical protein
MGKMSKLQREALSASQRALPSNVPWFGQPARFFTKCQPSAETFFAKPSPHAKAGFAVDFSGLA